MMKRNSTLLLTFFLAMNVFAQDIDWKKAPLNPVPVYYTPNHFNIRGPIYEYKSTGFDGKIFYLVFNQDGYLIEKITSQSGGSFKEMTEYEYAAKGVLKKIKINKLDSRGNPKDNPDEFAILYDRNGLILSMENLRSRYKTTFSYDKNKNLTAEISRSPAGSISLKTEYVYNSNGQLLSQKITEGNETKEFRLTYSREEGNLVVTLQTYKNGKLAERQHPYPISSDFIRQKRMTVFKNPEIYSFDSLGHEAFKKDYVRVNLDQLNNLRGQYSYILKKDLDNVNIRYYNNILSVVQAANTQSSPSSAPSNTLVPLNTKKPLLIKKIRDNLYTFHQDENQVEPPKSLLKSNSGHLIAFYEPFYHVIFAKASNLALGQKVASDQILSSTLMLEYDSSARKTYIIHKSKYLGANDYKLYLSGSSVLYFMMPAENRTFVLNRLNGPAFLNYSTSGGFAGMNYLEVKKDKTHSLIRNGYKIPAADYEIKPDPANAEKGFVYYKGKKEFVILNYKTLFEMDMMVRIIPAY